MIDFRYLLTTIVAVFLALAIGLLIGSGMLAGPLGEDLQRQVDETVARNNELQARITERDRRIEAEDQFGLLLEPRLIEAELTGDAIVLIRFEGTDGALLDRLREAIQMAGGTVATTVTVNERIAMSDESAVENLREDLPEALADEDTIADALGRALGSAAANDSSGAAGGPSFEEVAAPLVENGFIEVDTERDLPVPFGADFIVAAGGEGERPYEMERFVEPLLTGLASGVAEVVAVEGWRSGWDFVANLRESDVRDSVATVDHGDTVAGSVSVVLELDRIPGNDPGHYGFREGADGIAPESVSGD